jgi:hypothetical protein
LKPTFVSDGSGWSDISYIGWDRRETVVVPEGAVVTNQEVADVLPIR